MVSPVTGSLRQYRKEGVAASAVLAVYHPIAKSHSMFLERAARDLEAAGHNVTFLHTPLTQAAEGHPSPAITGPLHLYQEKEKKDWVMMMGGARFPLIATAAEDELQRVLDRLLWARHLSLLETYLALISLAAIFSRQCRLIHDPGLSNVVHQKSPSYQQKPSEGQ